VTSVQTEKAILFDSVIVRKELWKMTNHELYQRSLHQSIPINVNTLRRGDADLRFYITTVQDGRSKSAFLTRAYFPCTIHLIMAYIEPVSEWSC